MQAIGVILLVLLATALSGQSFDYLQTETKADSLLSSGRHRELRALYAPLHKNRQGYPASYRRVALSYYLDKNYVSAARYYEQALRFNSFDTLALDGLFFSLQETGELPFGLPYLSKLPASFSRRKTHKRFVVCERIEVESSLKNPGNTNRSNATYVHVSMRSRLSYRWYLSWAYSSFAQPLILPLTGIAPGFSEIDINQRQLYFKPEYYAGSNTRIYLSTAFIGTFFDGNKTSGLSSALGAQHNFTRWRIRAEVVRTFVQDSLIWQPGLQFTGMPFGNTSLFITWKVNHIKTSTEAYPVHFFSAGTRLGRNVWCEGFIIPTRWKFLSDREGLYLYNPFDDPLNRAGFTITSTLGGKAAIEVAASRERFRDIVLDLNYNQYSFTLNFKLTL